MQKTETGKSNGSNVFRRKQRTNKVPSNIISGFEETKKVPVTF